MIVYAKTLQGKTIELDLSHLEGTISQAGVQAYTIAEEVFEKVGFRPVEVAFAGVKYKVGDHADPYQVIPVKDGGSVIVMFRGLGHRGLGGARKSRRSRRSKRSKHSKRSRRTRRS